MGSYLVRRFGLMLLTLFGISLIIFVLLRLVPGNIVDILFDSAGMVNPADKARIEQELGLDRSLPMQYAAWIGGIVQGDLGFSYVSEKSAWAEIAPRIPVSARLAGTALLFAIAIGVPLGVISAVRQNSALDYLLRVLMAFVALFGAMPIYTQEARSWTDAVLLVLVPAATVGFRSSALIMRLTRSAMLEVLRQDYIRTAHAKGAYPRAVNYRHALRNAMLPVVTVIGMEAAFLAGGLIVTEPVFNIPGLARFLVESIRNRDYPIVQNLVMLIAFLVVTINFVVDLMYAALDPRIRVGG